MEAGNGEFEGEGESGVIGGEDKAGIGWDVDGTDMVGGAEGCASNAVVTVSYAGEYRQQVLMRNYGFIQANLPQRETQPPAPNWKSVSNFPE